MRRHLIPLAAALLTLAPVVCAAASPPAPDGLSQRVRVADLDLRSEAGARVALQRIRQAADVVCGGEPDGRELARYSAFQTCVRTAVNRTVAQSDSPALAALNGTPPASSTLAAAN